MIRSARLRVFLGLTIGLATLGGVVAFLQKRSGYYQHPPTTPAPSPVASTAANQNTRNGATTPLDDLSGIEASMPTPEIPGSPSPPSPTPTPSLPPIGFVGTLKLIVPVAGVRPDQLRDTFSDSRSEGRLHDAIDIPAPAGTPVLAVADGQIVKLFQSERGGSTIYQASADKKLIYYYAHLQGYADGLVEGKYVRQGEIIGYVGDTGNAGPENYHLHFSIAVVADPKRYWEGVNINPYPLLQK